MRFPRALRSFDVTAVLVVAASLLIAFGGALVSRTRGPLVVATNPTDGAVEVSPRSVIRITLSEPIEVGADLTVTLMPSTAVAVSIDGRSLLIRPEGPLTAATAYQVTVEAGVPTTAGRRVRDEIRITFTTSPPRLLALRRDDAGVEQLAITELVTGETTMLTDDGPVLGVEADHFSSRVVIANAVAGSPSGSLGTSDPGGTRFVAFERKAIIDRRLAPTLLFTCSDTCDDGRMAPPGAPPGVDLVVTDRRPPSPPRVVLVDLQAGRSRPIGDRESVGLDARFSSGGNWIAFTAPVEGGVRLLQLKDGRSLLVPSRGAEPVSWHPQEPILLVSDRVEGDEGPTVSRLFIVDPVGLSMGPLLNSVAPWYDDRGAVYAPDGAWVAFRRRDLRGSDGAQIWLLATDTGEARPLTNRPELDFGLPAFSGDGRLIAVSAAPLRPARPAGDTGTRESQLYLLDFDRDVIVPLGNGRNPLFLP